MVLFIFEIHDDFLKTINQLLNTTVQVAIGLIIPMVQVIKFLEASKFYSSCRGSPNYNNSKYCFNDLATNEQCYDNCKVSMRSSCFYGTITSNSFLKCRRVLP
ncbi:unnamed protein product [Paramecium primaurelia]|uniref:Uncharacterized protein n=1 Tax=Paramecium primaurelia TaxID=5886 RepID=A0A8S1P3R2_PARPR|nr:unnamed protein product [Paramecium primaurelia]